ncbi:hypothetical protein DU500_11230 [Haloplanus rubicundus]|uniref:Uncharacterized protein n=1 Tax=Haloplanus rubicundus TaxID=1547898 RepID=A0A345E430_9EURY|nr:hypothetical protein [Haloplanus rubicundus]AXG06952.1 hypothetical protein DU500_11230 [Haloplanus rubicundus]AXG10322.1 hypothetical protein DU484_10965 [Haloplanus rubicundus]
MADKKFTLLELHLDEGSIQVGPSVIGDEQNTITEPESKDSDESESGDCCAGRKAGKLLVVFLVLAVLALGLKKVLGGGDDLEELEELAELDEEA